MDLSIIIVNYNVYDDVKICIESIYKYLNKLKFEVIVVDNNSTDRSILKINDIFPDVRLIPSEDNSGFSSANNLAMKIAEGKYFLLINPDIIFKDNAVDKMIEFIEDNNDAGVVGPVQIRPNGNLERYYCFFPTFYSRFCQEFGLYMTAPVMKYRFNGFWDESIARGIPFKVDWLMGSCMMVRKEIFENTGGFNEAFFLYEEETEWQFRMKKLGWQSYILPECRVIHNHHSSSAKLGNFFVLFHEFRSRIIFSKIHDRSLVYFLRTLMIISALILRFFIYLRYIFKWNYFKKRILLTVGLLKFALSSKETVLNDRFNFSQSVFSKK